MSNQCVISFLSPTMRTRAGSVLFIIVLVFLYVDGDLRGSYEYSVYPELYTAFYLCLSPNLDDIQVLPLYNANVLRLSRFNPNLPTRMLIHGFNGHKDSEFNRFVATAYLIYGYVNVIVVDWSHGVTLDNRYLGLAIANTPRLGYVIAQFLDFLSSALNYPLNAVYLVGYSLGAYAAGFAGKSVRAGKIGAIFALDPPGPLLLNDTELRLASNDAHYVEVIHTNHMAFGSLPTMGHADFYANGGGVQPGCNLDNIMCSHQRSYQIFAESINDPAGFRARKCRSLVEAIGMLPCFGNGSYYFVGGEPANVENRGIFFFRTGLTGPFAIERT